MKYLALTAAVAAIVSTCVGAQTIERVKMTDNDLSCQQVYAEITQMDGVIAKAGQPVVGVQVVPVDNGAGTAAGAAVAVSALQSTGALGGFGGFGGGLGGMFGNIAQSLAQGAAASQQASANAAAQQAALAQQNQAVQTQQAQGRKEHLTGLFLSKGCKMGDIQK